MSIQTQNDEMNAIIECLRVTFTSKDMQLRRQAEEKLSSFESNIILYTKWFLEAIISPDISLDNKIKLSIVLLLKRTIIKYLNTQLSNNKAEIIEIIKSFIKTLIDPKIENKLIQNLSESFQALLNSLEEMPKLLTELSIFLCQSLNSSSIPFESFKGIIIIFSSIILSNSFSKLNDCDILKQIIPLTKQMLEVSYSNLQGIADIEQNKDNFISYNKTIGDLYGFYFTCLFKVKSSRQLKDFLNIALADVNTLGIKMMFIVIPKYVPNPPICWTQDQMIDSCLNNMKTQILRFICAIMSSLTDVISDKETVDYHMEIMKMISINLEYILINKYQEIQTMDQGTNHKYSLLIAQMILYLNKALSKKTLRSEFEAFDNNFFKNIILPLLIITKTEIDQSIEEPGDYSVILEDAMFNHKNKTIKSSACQLLKTFITQSSEGFISIYITQLFDSSLSNSTDTEKSLLTIDDFIVKINPSKEVRLDLCLLLFCILKGRFRNEQIEINICLKMNEYSNILFSEKAFTYIKHKLCIVLCQYFTVFQSIDDDSNSITISCIQYLFRNIFVENNPLVAEEATQSLNKIIEQTKMIYRLHLPLINQLFVEIIKIIPKTTMVNVFDVIYQIKTKTETTLLDTELFVSLCNRISVEAAQKSRLKFIVHHQKTNDNDEEVGSKKSRGKHENELFITKCFNIIRFMMNEEKFVLDNLQIIEANLKPLFFYMKNPTKIDFDEDLILIMSSIIKYIKAIPELGYALMPELYKYAQKNKGMLLDLYELINLYLIYGAPIIEQNEQYCKAINDVFKYGSTDEKFNESPFYVSLLTHLWLLISKTIPVQVVSNIIMNSITCMTKIYSWVNDPNKKAELSESKFNFTGCLLVLYTSFINYSPVCIEILNKRNQMHELIQWTQFAFKIKVISYPTKMIILSLCKMINLEYFIRDNVQFLNFGLQFLFRQQNHESKKLKDSSNQKYFNRFVDEDEFDMDNDHLSNKSNSDDDDDDEDKENRFDVESEIESLIARSINPFKDTDEFKEFRIAIEEFKSKTPDQFRLWTESLSDFDRTKLYKMLQTVRIDLEMKSDHISIPRKIVKVKRNINK